MVKIVAEVGSNFTPGDLTSAIEMVHVAADCGADLVKFQDWHPIEQMNRTDEWKERAGSWTLPVEWHMPLRAAADDCGIGYMCSVFTLKAWERARYGSVFPFPPIKIASSELINQRLLAEFSYQGPYRMDDDTRRPIALLSLGEVSHSNQVHTAIARLSRYETILMACIAEYPVGRPLDLFDSLIFAQTFGLPVGVSSHLVYTDALKYIPQLVKRGAEIVEMHLRTKETLGDCPDNGPWALFPNEFKEVVEAVREQDG